MDFPFSVFPSSGYKNTSFQVFSDIDGLIIHISCNGIVERSLKLNSQSATTLADLRSVGKYTLSCVVDNIRHERCITISDAYRYGSSTLKSVIAFDELEHAFILMKDRMYIFNERTKQIILENNISPSEIKYFGNDIVLFITRIGGHEGITNIAAYSLKSMKIVDELLQRFRDIFICEKDNKIWCDDIFTNDILCYEVAPDGSLHIVMKVQGARKHCINTKSSHLLADQDSHVRVINLRTLEYYCIDKKCSNAISSEGYSYEIIGDRIISSNVHDDYHVSFDCSDIDLHIDETGFLHIGESLRFIEDVEYDSMVSKRIDKYSVPDSAPQYKLHWGSIPIMERIRQCSIKQQFYPTVNGMFMFSKQTVKELSSIRCQYDKTKGWVNGPSFEERALFKLEYRSSVSPTILHEVAGSIEILSYQSNLLIYRVGKIQYAATGGITEECASKAYDKNVTATAGTQVRQGEIGTDSITISRPNEIIELPMGSEFHMNEGAYVESYLSPDGYRLMLRNKKNEYQLFNIANNTTEKYFSEKFVSFSKEGNLIFNDDRRRVAKIIDPFNLQDITPSDYHYYRFLSPDGKLYSHLTTQMKFYDLLQEKYLTYQSLLDYQRELDYPLFPSKTADPAEAKKTIDENRKQMFERYRAKFNDLGIQSSSGVTSYAIVRRTKFVEIGIVGTERRAEIELPTDLEFFNYAAFSHDNRFYACVGKPSRNGLISISEIAFDPTNQTISVHNTFQSLRPPKATWVCGISKTGYFATYDSIPQTYLCKCKDDLLQNPPHFTELPGKNFLCFSPSGDYMAMSEQGYDPMTFGGYGHQESNAVHIARTETGEIVDSYTHHGDRIKEIKNVVFVAFSEDEKRLMSMSEDGTIIVRNLNLQKSASGTK